MRYLKKAQFSLKFIALFVVVALLVSSLSWYAFERNSQVYANIVNNPVSANLLPNVFKLNQYKQLSLPTAIEFNPSQPFNLKFFFDTQSKLQEKEASRMIKYFLGFLAMPEEKLWVNLSPYERERVIDQDLAKLDIGKDMLIEDYLLKQLSSSLTNPNTAHGKRFWEKVYQVAERIAGTRKVPINTCYKVWVVPDIAEIYEHSVGAGSKPALNKQNKTIAFVKEAKLKVMMENDDHSNVKQQGKGLISPVPDRHNLMIQKINQEAKRIFKEQLLPIIEREINQSIEFAPLRQLYYSLILATYFKTRLKDNFFYAQYIDKGKAAPITLKQKNVKQVVYQKYLDNLRKGIFNVIKEENSLNDREKLQRRYSSGGLPWAGALKLGDNLKVTRQENMPGSGFFGSFYVKIGLTNGKTRLYHSLPTIDLDKIMKKVPGDFKNYPWRQKNVRSVFSRYPDSVEAFISLMKRAVWLESNDKLKAIGKINVALADILAGRPQHSVTFWLKDLDQAISNLEDDSDDHLSIVERLDKDFPWATMKMTKELASQLNLSSPTLRYWLSPLEETGVFLGGLWTLLDIKKSFTNFVQAVKTQGVKQLLHYDGKRKMFFNWLKFQLLRTLKFIALSRVPVAFVSIVLPIFFPAITISSFFLVTGVAAFVNAVAFSYGHQANERFQVFFLAMGLNAASVLTGGFIYLVNPGYGFLMNLTFTTLVPTIFHWYYHNRRRDLAPLFSRQPVNKRVVDALTDVMQTMDKLSQNLPILDKIVHLEGLLEKVKISEETKKLYLTQIANVRQQIRLGDFSAGTGQKTYSALLESLDQSVTSLTRISKNQKEDPQEVILVDSDSENREEETIVDGEGIISESSEVISNEQKREDEINHNLPDHTVVESASFVWDSSQEDNPQKTDSREENEVPAAEQSNLEKKANETSREDATFKVVEEKSRDKDDDTKEESGEIKVKLNQETKRLEQVLPRDRSTKPYPEIPKEGGDSELKAEESVSPPGEEEIDLVEEIDDNNKKPILKHKVTTKHLLQQRSNEEESYDDRIVVKDVSDGVEGIDFYDKEGIKTVPGGMGGKTAAFQMMDREKNLDDEEWEKTEDKSSVPKKESADLETDKKSSEKIKGKNAQINLAEVKKVKAESLGVKIDSSDITSQSPVPPLESLPTDLDQSKKHKSTMVFKQMSGTTVHFEDGKRVEKQISLAQAELDKIEAVSQQGTQAFAAGDFAQAEKFFNQVLTMVPEEFQGATSQYAQARRYLGTTIPRARQMALQRQSQAETLYQQAVAAFQNKNYETAKELFGQAQAAVPVYKDTQFYLDTKIPQAEKEAQAEILYQQALEHFKNNKLKNAIDLFRQVRELIPEYQESKKYIELARVRGWCYQAVAELKQGDLEKSNASLLRAKRIVDKSENRHIKSLLEQEISQAEKEIKKITTQQQGIKQRETLESQLLDTGNTTTNRASTTRHGEEKPRIEKQAVVPPPPAKPREDPKSKDPDPKSQIQDPKKIEALQITPERRLQAQGALHLLQIYGQYYNVDAGFYQAIFNQARGILASDDWSYLSSLDWQKVQERFFARILYSSRKNVSKDYDFMQAELQEAFSALGVGQRQTARIMLNNHQRYLYRLEVLSRHYVKNPRQEFSSIIKECEAEITAKVAKTSSQASLFSPQLRRALAVYLNDIRNALLYREYGASDENSLIANELEHLRQALGLDYQDPVKPQAPVTVTRAAAKTSSVQIQQSPPKKSFPQRKNEVVFKPKEEDLPASPDVSKYSRADILNAYKKMLSDREIDIVGVLNSIIKGQQRMGRNVQAFQQVLGQVKNLLNEALSFIHSLGPLKYDWQNLLTQLETILLDSQLLYPESLGGMRNTLMMFKEEVGLLQRGEYQVFLGDFFGRFHSFPAFSSLRFHSLTPGGHASPLGGPTRSVGGLSFTQPNFVKIHGANPAQVTYQEYLSAFKKTFSYDLQKSSGLGFDILEIASVKK